MILNFTFWRLNESLSSARTKFLESGLISKEDFSALVRLDQSKTNKFVEALCRFYLEGGNDIRLIGSTLQTYESLLKKKIPGFRSDINSFKSFFEWCSYMDGFAVAKSRSELRKGAKKSVEVILDNERWFIVRPKNWEESKIFGAGTNWCTTAKTEKGLIDWENYYNELKYNLYYLLDKTKRPFKYEEKDKDPDKHNYDVNYKMCVISTGEKYRPFQLLNSMQDTETKGMDTEEILTWMRENGLSPSLFKPKKRYDLDLDQDDDDLF